MSARLVIRTQTQNPSSNWNQLNAFSTSFSLVLTSNFVHARQFVLSKGENLQPANRHDQSDVAILLFVHSIQHNVKWSANGKTKCLLWMHHNLKSKEEIRYYEHKWLRLCSMFLISPSLPRVSLWMLNCWVVLLSCWIHSSLPIHIQQDGIHYLWGITGMPRPVTSLPAGSWWHTNDSGSSQGTSEAIPDLLIVLRNLIQSGLLE